MSIIFSDGESDGDCTSGFIHGCDSVSADRWRECHLVNHLGLSDIFIVKMPEDCDGRIPVRKIEGYSLDCSVQLAGNVYLGPVFRIDELHC